MNALETLLRSLVVALGAVGLSVILRNAPVIRGWVQAGKKPWACNVCLPTYLCAFMVAALYGATRDASVAFAYLPGYALAYWILETHMRPPVVPKFWPDDSGEDNG